MLEFHGIRLNHQGTPERFGFSLALREALNLSLVFYEQLGGNYDKIVGLIDNKIEKLFANSDSAGNKRFRLAAAQLFRVKDIICFIRGFTASRSLKLEINKILNSNLAIDKKWFLIEPLIEQYLTSLPPKESDGQLSDPDSDLNLTLQMISLFFLEQDEERPPANVEIRFVRRQFPRIFWKKNDGFSGSVNPVWLPKNLYCRSSHLYYRIMRKISATAGEPLLPSQPNTSNNRRPLPLHYFGDQAPDEISLEFDDSDEQNIQLPLIPETVAESLLSLQKLIQKKYSYNGVKHFLGIFRQLSESNLDNVCRFDVKKHFKLVAKISKKGSCSDKQHFLFDSIFKLIFNLRVKRRWRENDCLKEAANPFVLQLGVESISPGSVNQVKKLLLDPLFSASAENPFRLGAHLNIIPDEIFGESIYKHPLLPGLSSFLTGVWLNNFPQERGVLEKTTLEIIEGCAFNITPSVKYSFIRRIRSELIYMEDKSYISKYNFIKDQNGDPWKDRHRVAASETIINNITAKPRLNHVRRDRAKLIA